MSKEIGEPNEVTRAELADFRDNLLSGIRVISECVGEIGSKEQSTQWALQKLTDEVHTEIMRLLSKFCDEEEEENEE